MSGRFDSLSETLLRQGIAPRHVRRYARELDDHFSDLVNEEMAKGLSRPQAEIQAEGRLGRIEDLVEAMAARQELRSWISRKPGLVLVAGPLLALILLDFMQLISIAQLVQNFGTVPYRWGGMLPPLWLKPIMLWLFRFDNFLLPIVLGWIFAAASLRQRIGKGWAIGGLLLLALVSGPPFLMHYQWPSNPMDQWSFGVGLVLHATSWFAINTAGRAFVTFILTAGPFWFLFRSIDRSAPSVPHLPGQY